MKTLRWENNYILRDIWPAPIFGSITLLTGLYTFGEGVDVSTFEFNFSIIPTSVILLAFGKIVDVLLIEFADVQSI